MVGVAVGVVVGVAVGVGVVVVVVVVVGVAVVVVVGVAVGVVVGVGVAVGVVVGVGVAVVVVVGVVVGVGIKFQKERIIMESHIIQFPQDPVTIIERMGDDVLRLSDCAFEDLVNLEIDYIADGAARAITGYSAIKHMEFVLHNIAEGILEYEMEKKRATT